MNQLNGHKNLVICQKSKVDDWIEHFRTYYPCYQVLDLTNSAKITEFMVSTVFHIGVINYDLIWRRKAILASAVDTLMLDESSLIQNESSNRSKAIIHMDYKNLILLSGTPIDGKYENIYSQCRMLGWNISKDTFWHSYVNWELVKKDNYYTGKKIIYRKVTGYKHIDNLIQNLHKCGCIFMKTSEVIDLPSQTFTKIKVKQSPEYKQFMKDRVITIRDVDLVGSNSLTKLLCARELCGIYSQEKLSAFQDILDSTSDRLIVFYNFTGEYRILRDLCLRNDRPISVINGESKNLESYDNDSNSVTLVQYQSGSMGMNLQKANKIIYYSLPLRSMFYEQSKKRIHRIGQDRPCTYYQLIVKGSVEEHILKTLDMRRDYTDALFEEDYGKRTRETI